MNRRLSILNQLVALGLSMALIYSLIPQYKRRRAALLAIEHARRAVVHLGAWSGAAGMRLELKGDMQAAQHCYDTALRLLGERQQSLTRLARKVAE